MAPALDPLRPDATNSGAIAPLPDGWTPAELNGVPAIEKRWRLANFAQAMALANAVAELAETLNHHPDLHVAWGSLRVVWSTHDAGGVTPLDLQAARAVNALSAAQPPEPEPS